MENTLSYDSLVPHIKNLRRCGCYHLDNDQPKLHRIAHMFYRCINLIFLFLYTVQQLVKLYQVRGEIDKLVDTMPLFFTMAGTMFKQVVLSLKADQIDELLNSMKGWLFNQGEPHHKMLLSQTIRLATIILRGFNYVALTTCLLWFIGPIVLHLQGKHVEFVIWLPFDSNENPQFYFVSVYVYFAMSWVAFNNTTIDSFIAFFLVQCKTQLSILRFDLETLVDKSKEESKSTSVDFSIVFHKRFGNILQHHRKILRYAETIQDVFSASIMYHFLVGGWILCTAAYRTLMISTTYVDFITISMYISCMATELFLYCYCGNEVNLESDKLMKSAYTMDWTETSWKRRKDLIIFMERIKRPIQPMAGSIIPLANSTFVSILRSSYSFYAFLKNSKGNEFEEF